ncbi:hypothetical protein TNCV_1949531 [Trichonephila clavipes]|nr:hypothetical protein TNCV_1949531 [Trichonephila clavipes]
MISCTSNEGPLRFPDLNPLYFFFWGHFKLVVYETPVATVEDLTTQAIVGSADIASTLDLLERTSNNPSSVGVGWATTYVAAISNDSYDNHLAFEFLTRAVLYCSYYKHALRLINAFLTSYCLEITSFITAFGHYCN